MVAVKSSLSGSVGFFLQLMENNNRNDNNVIRNVLKDKGLVKSVVFFFSSLLHENFSLLNRFYSEIFSFGYGRIIQYLKNMSILLNKKIKKIILDYWQKFQILYNSSITERKNFGIKSI